MIKLFTAQNATEVGLIESLLENSGIETITRSNLSIGVGEVPVTEAWPELWLVKEADLPKAQELLNRRNENPDPLATEWICSDCGEENEGQFDACWKCSAARPT